MTTDGRSVTEMQKKVDKHSKRSALFRFILAKGDKDKIVAWNQELVRILHVFNVGSIGYVGNPQTQQLPFRPNWQLTPT
jgi:hypothetical protein